MRRARQSPRDREDGSAALEFAALSVVLVVPLVYLVVTLVTLQRASFGITQAAREAARALATADTTSQGLDRARAAVGLALRDQGVTASPVLAVVGAGASCEGATSTAAATVSAGARYTVCVRVQLPLPYTDRALIGDHPPSVRLAASSLVVVDDFRSDASSAGMSSAGGAP